MRSELEVLACSRRRRGSARLLATALFALAAAAIACSEPRSEPVDGGGRDGSMAGGGRGGAGAGGASGRGGMAGTIAGGGGGGAGASGATGGGGMAGMGTAGIGGAGAAGTSGTSGSGAAGTSGAGGSGNAGRGGTGGMAGTIGGAGASGTSGNAGAAGRGGTGGVACGAGMHACPGVGCVSNTSIAGCGTLCSPCAPPAGGTATCDGTSCGFDCGSMRKCATKCTTGCCVDADCPVQNGMVGRCDTSTNACNYMGCASGFKPCGQACIANASCCADADCPGTCRRCPSAGGTCATVQNADDTDSCAGTCDAAGACKSKRGQVCNATAGGCLTGSVCAPDGYCCDTACTAPCMACDIQGMQGTCTAVASGPPHSNHTACAGTGTSCAGTCQGRSDGACVYGTASCGSATCSGPKIIDAPTCSSGACVTPASRDCAGHYVCSQNMCRTSCTAHTDCQAGYFCANGTCHLTAVKLALGEAASYAILADGTMRAWGSNYSGQLGVSSPTTTSPTPVTVPGMTNVVAAAAGAEHACASRTDGSVYCWGRNASGVLGNGTLTDTNFNAPARVMNLGVATTVGSGYYHNCAALNNGQVWCWGLNGTGALGTGMVSMNPQGVATPVQMINVTGATAVAGGTFNSYALGSLIWSVGDNSSGQLGNGPRPAYPPFGSTATPVNVALFMTAVSITSGPFGYHVCALVNTGSAWCWGDNSAGQLGASSTVPLSGEPLQISGLPTTPTMLAAGDLHTCARLQNGSVYCWGSNLQGQLGNSNMSEFNNVPMMVSGLTNVSAIAAGGRHTCALKNDGSVVCWGQNVSGELGNGSMVSTPSPQPVVW
jgi:alpha-tubulin suppressor-like RCC1 family protein